MVDVDVLEGSKHLVLLFTDGTWFEGRRWFHCHKRQDLAKMRDNHVPVGPGGVVERAAVFDRQSLWDINLNVLNVLAVPNGLEQTIGETKGQNILRRLLGQEMIDSKDLVLGEDLMHRRVEQFCAG